MPRIFVCAGIQGCSAAGDGDSADRRPSHGVATNVHHMHPNSAANCSSHNSMSSSHSWSCLDAEADHPSMRTCTHASKRLDIDADIMDTCSVGTGVLRQKSSSKRMTREELRLLSHDMYVQFVHGESHEGTLRALKNQSPFSRFVYYLRVLGLCVGTNLSCTSLCSAVPVCKTCFLVV